ncbi:hypothetical protein EMIHUDRAFT_209810 [Emiliania huxleyi CCMP1516]|uniref:Uncharacterized protein n=2 Tax=Emiliania huxleyi TaxID=2903 RepID=A0A0D3J2T7_EMIH1|nr:hypothetical protein EMIHUDRAFT_209810 [Emiliania huxleyi CCMP1516]EOD17822.1 hypothetical protein EMIHUDRAFT_209810 [Emiliania huxleyi CCMP1516]|eukprot:XP_005770251.1 hypothetical protein EMIHUDRAFT_209810 [Emiliania huxleyi CCMP1516]
MVGAFDQVMEPLSAVELKLQACPECNCESITLLAQRPPPFEPYAFAMRIPKPNQPLRERALELLTARAVTIAAAIIGTAHVSLVCEFDETFQAFGAFFHSNPKLAAHLKQYGQEFKVSRAQLDDVPSVMRSLPFIPASAAHSKHDNSTAAAAGASGNLADRDVYIGVDYGRSDVKCAAVDVDGTELATYVTRWWRAPGRLADADACAAAVPVPVEEGSREYVDPAMLTTIEAPLRCMGGGGGTIRVCGLGLSAAGCVIDGKLCGLPPAFAGCDPTAAAPTLRVLEKALWRFVARHVSARVEGARVDGAPTAAVTMVAPGDAKTFLVNDGDASALWGSKGLASAEGENATAIGLYLSCGTGLAGGVVNARGERCSGGVFEMGKLIVGLPRPPSVRSVEGASAGVGAGAAAGATAATTAMALPTHDTLGVAGAAQGMAGTQRSFFHLLAARGGARIEGKAEQRSAIVAMQSRPLDAAVRTMFEQLGTSLAQFVTELGAYLPFQLTHVEVGGKLTDAASGEVMLTRAGRYLAPYGISVRRANESEFGQALAMAECARDAPVGGVE